jgi:hypothetical protein
VLLDAREEIGGASAQRWTAVVSLDDRPDARNEPHHQARWNTWLQLANVLQFLDGDGEAVLCTWNEADSGEISAEDLVVVLPAAAAHEDGHESVRVTADLPPEAAEELELIVDDEARGLTRLALLAGAPVPEAGYEAPGGDSGVMFEVAWPAQRVGIVTDAVVEGRADVADWARRNGWDVRDVAKWTPGDLVRVIEERG